MSHLVSIFSYRDLPLAELAKAKLESEGIECFLFNKHHVGVNWLYSFAIGGVIVQVREEDVKVAKQTLDKDESSYLDSKDLDFPEPEVSDLCSRCGSPNLELVKYSRYSAALIGLTSLPLLFWGDRFKCKDCGYKIKK